MEAPLERVALLGGGTEELELLADLHAQSQVEIAGVYDPDPSAPAFGLAEVVGIATGTTPEFRSRLDRATHRILPVDPRRAAVLETEPWNGETLTVEAARRRWGGGTPVPNPRLTAAAHTSALAALTAAPGYRDLSALADWLLDQAMRTVGANGGSLQRLALDTGELYMLAARGLSDRLVRSGRHRVGEGIAGVVAATRAPQILHGPKPGRVARERGSVASSISIPLDDAAGLIGVLNVSTTLPGHTFDDAHLQGLEELAPRIVELLRTAEAVETSAGDDAVAFARLLRNPVAAAANFDLQAACESLRLRLEADGLRLAVATDDANWRILRTAGTPIAVPAPSRTRMGRALVEDCWVHAAEAGHGADDVDAALDRAIDGGLSRVYAPLAGLRPVGVLVLDFRSLRAAEACLRQGRTWVTPLGLALEALVRGRAQERRLARLATLAHYPQTWRSDPESLFSTLARQAAELVGARAAVMRRCDERLRTFSRPATHGIDPAAVAAWRRFDLQVTEHTLVARHSSITTAAGDEGDALTDAAPRRSLITVPLQHEGAIVGVVNVYDRIAADRADADVFTWADREILDAFASLAAPFVAEAPDPPREGSTAEAAVSQVASEGKTAAARSEKSIPMRLETLLNATPIRPVGVVVLRFAGLNQLSSSEAADSLRDQLTTRARASIDADDECGWLGPEDLVLASTSASGEPARLAERVLAAVRPLLARLSADGIQLDVRVGTSRAPLDGVNAPALIEIAAVRAG